MDEFAAWDGDGRGHQDLAGCAPTAHLLHQAELTRVFIDRARR
jgi:hypothetical protein